MGKFLLYYYRFSFNKKKLLKIYLNYYESHYFLRIIAFIFYILKYFGYDFSDIFNTLNNLTLGTVDWFYQKIINFLEMLNNNDKNN